VNGSQRWIRLAGYSIQPSELAKLTLPLLLARYVTRRAPQPALFDRLQLVGPWLLCSLLILLEPDLGSTVFLTISLALVLLLGGWPARELFAVPVLAVPGVLLTLSLRPYQWQRVQGFITVFTDPAAAPYQVRQSLTTVGVGGWWGTGLGQGWQKLSFLPEANTDFIFAVIGEELGLAGTLLTLALWWGVWKTGSGLLSHLPDGSFARVAGMTLLAQLLIQAAINVAVVTALLPPKGIPHPFISYGGSSLCVSCLAIGLIVSLSRAQRPSGGAGESDVSPDCTDEHDALMVVSG
jgi:cell division protein FtsW